jgi:putative heme iron utilization protein
MKEAPKQPSHAEHARAVAEHARFATLSTLAKDPAGFPYGSLVAIACDDLGRPLLLLSTLAEHTQNLALSEKASVLLAAPGNADPLAAARVTLIGPCRKIEGEAIQQARELFLRKHPEAAAYASFKDFALYRLEPVALRYVGGFGRMSWVSTDDYRSAEASPIAASGA